MHSDEIKKKLNVIAEVNKRYFLFKLSFNYGTFPIMFKQPVARKLKPIQIYCKPEHRCTIIWHKTEHNITSIKQQIRDLVAIQTFRST